MFNLGHSISAEFVNFLGCQLQLTILVVWLLRDYLIDHPYEPKTIVTTITVDTNP